MSDNEGKNGEGKNGEGKNGEAERRDPEERELEERARAIALLENNHSFPTDYAISVIARNADEVTALVLAAAFEDCAGERPAGAHQTLPSSGGKYVSHRLAIPCASAEHVLRVYARLRAVDGVLTIL